jgi:hypothetical protein
MGIGLKGSSNFDPFKDNFFKFPQGLCKPFSNQGLEDFTNLMHKLSQWIVTK